MVRELLSHIKSELARLMSLKAEKHENQSDLCLVSYHREFAMCGVKKAFL